MLEIKGLSIEDPVKRGAPNLVLDNVSLSMEAGGIEGVGLAVIQP